MDKLVSTEWLAASLGAQELVIIDATMHLPGSERDAAADARGPVRFEYAEEAARQLQHHQRNRSHDRYQFRVGPIEHEKRADQSGQNH